MGVKSRVEHSAEQRQEILAELEGSPLSVTAFAQQKGLSRTLLSVWRHRYGSAAPSSGPGPKAVAWQELKLHELVQSRWAAEIVLAEGITVRLDAQGQAVLLERLLGGGR
jgi:transposase-like protein